MALAVLRGSHGSDHPLVLEVMLEHGAVLRSLGRGEEALAFFEEAHRRRKARFGENDHRTLEAATAVGMVLLDLDRTDRGVAVMNDALARAEKNHTPGSQVAFALRATLMNFFVWKRQFDLVEPLAIRQVDFCRRHMSPPDVAGGLSMLGWSLVWQEKYAEARPVLTECLKIRRTALPAGHWQTGSAKSLLGWALTGLGEFEAAEPLLLEGQREVQDAPEFVRKLQHRNTVERIVHLYDAWSLR